MNHGPMYPWRLKTVASCFVCLGHLIRRSAWGKLFDHQGSSGWPGSDSFGMFRSYPTTLPPFSFQIFKTEFLIPFEQTWQLRIQNFNQNVYKREIFHYHYHIRFPEDVWTWVKAWWFQTWFSPYRPWIGALHQHFQFTSSIPIISPSYPHFLIPFS